MERRLILAMALSLGLVYLWSGLNPKTQVQPTKIPLVATPAPEVALPVQEQPEEPTQEFSLDKFILKFTESKGSIKEVVFKDYGLDNLKLHYGFMVEENNLIFHKESSGPDSAIFVHKDNEKEIVKRFLFNNSSYYIELEIEVKNLTENPLVLNYPILLGSLNFIESPIDTQFLDLAVGSTDKTQHFNGKKNITIEDVKYLAIRNKYFCAIVEPYSSNYTAFINKIKPQETLVGLRKKELVVPAGQKVAEKYRIYIGPQDSSLISSINPIWGNIINYGMFDVIAQIFVQTIKFFYRLIHNWGVAIILLTVAIQILLYPLSLKQAHSMKKTQVLQPEVEALRKKYKDNPQKMNKEVMELYRVNKVNPFGGCLPMLIQMPIFIALYQVQSRLIYFKNAHFLWIKDLSSADKLFTFASPLPVFGKELSVNIIPILMAVLMFVQQKLTTVKAGVEMTEQQKMMTILFPIMLLVFLYNASSAFNLYMLITNLFMLMYQVQISKASK